MARKAKASETPSHLQIAIPHERATLMDIVPVARSLVSETVKIAHKQTLDAGLTIPCGSGCSACCYHLVPLSIPEAIYLSEEVKYVLPEEWERVERRCWEIANQVDLSFPSFLAQNTIRNMRDRY